jgi:arginyl-tRNA synthetase
MVYETITTAFESALRSLGLPEEVTLEHPTDPSHGDLATNVALVHAQNTGKSPRELAEDIITALPECDSIASVDIAGPGFINITLSREFLRTSIDMVLTAGDSWGANNRLEGQKVMVEHTQPNPFKPFHIGHLMSNTIGESLSRLYEFSGALVRRANYQGDVGLHVAKCLWGLKKTGGDASSVTDLAEAYVTGNSAYEDDESAKAEIVEYNKFVYEAATEIQEDYQTGRKVSLEHFEELYRILGTKFDHYFFESETTIPGRALVKEGLAEGVFKESEGAVVFPGEEHGLHTRVFLTKNGLPTYEAKELGLIKLKGEKWDFDHSITTTAVEQQEYFKVVYKAASLLMPELAKRLEHVSHGMMLLSSGKMSSRKGNVVTGESLLTDMLRMARKKVEERDLSPDEKEDIAAAVAVAAIKYSVLKQRAGKNITFDPDTALSFEGDSGPYLQYAHTRAASVLRKAAEAGKKPSAELAPRETSPLEHLMYRFPAVVARAQDEREPHHITTYLIEIASAWNSWYAAEQILDDSSTSAYKLAIAQAFAQTMKNGLYLLGIRAPERM